VPILLKYADAQLNIRPLKRDNVQQAIATYRTILRVEKRNYEAASKLVELYLQMSMSGEAELIAARALEEDSTLQKDSKGQTQTEQSLDLRRMLAIALASQRKFKEAAEELTQLIKEHPDQILAYELLSQLIEHRPQDHSQAPLFWFDEAVRMNPSNAQAYIIRGSYHLRQADIPKAILDFNLAQEQDLSDPDVRLRLADEFIKAKIFDKAKKHLLVIQEVEPTSQSLWKSWAKLALESESKTTMLNVAETGLKELSSQPWDFMPTATELFIRSNELDRADDCIDKLRQNDNLPATTAFLQGLVADEKGHGYEAVKCWNTAMQLGDKSPRIRIALTLTLARLGQRQAAMKQLQTLLAESPAFLQGHLLLAKLFAQTGNFSGMAESADKAKQLAPDNLEANLFYQQAKIQLLGGTQTDKNSLLYQDIEHQLAELDKATDGIQEVKLLQLQLAMQRDNYTRAQDMLSELKQAYPTQIKVVIAEVELLRSMNRIDEAVLKSRDAVRQFPDSVQAVRYLASLLSGQDKTKESEKVIKDAMAVIDQPIDHRELGLLLAELYGQWGQPDKAYQLFSSLAEKLPEDTLIKTRLLGCDQVLKNTDQAQQIINDIKSLEGQDGRQWRYEQAKLWLAQGNFNDQYPRLISLLKENLSAHPDDQSSRVLLAAAYEKAGRLSLAISTYTSALSRSPYDLNIIIPAITALYKADKYDQADEILRKVANAKLSHPELKKLEVQSHLRRGQLNSAGQIMQNLLADDPNNSSICLSLAILKMQQGQFAQADALLEKVNADEPDSLSIIVAQIQSNVLQKKSAQAISLCDEIVNNFNNASAYIIRGKTFVSLGQLDKAEKDFEQATIIQPDNAELFATKSNFHRSIGQFDIAVDDMEKAILLAPDNLGIQKQAIALFFASSSRESINRGNTILDNALAANPEDVALQLHKSRFLLSKGTVPATEQASGILEKITQEQPNLGQAWTLLAQTALSRQLPAKAMDIALRGLIHLPDNKSLLMLKAQSEAARSPALAIPTLKALLELNPANTDVVIYLANTYIAAEQSQKAVDLLKGQLASSNSNADERKIHISLAKALHKSGAKAQAKAKFDSLQLSDPNDPDVLLAQVLLLKDDQAWEQISQMVLHWCRNHPDDADTPHIIASDLAADQSSQPKKIAEELLRSILQRDHDSTPAMNTLAKLLLMTGRLTEAATLFQRILELQPDNVVAINNLAWILCEEHGKHQQALELAQRGLKIAPDYVDLIDTRGVLYDKLGQYDKAIKDFIKCLELYPDAAPARVASYLHLGKALAKLGRKDEAVESLRKSIELNIEIGGLSEVDHADAQHLVKKLLKEI
jgi:tetratricopeptide (TPR) repeat protein